MPHRKEHVLADVHQAGPAEVERAIKASADAWRDWSRTPWEERATVFLRAAELLAGPWRTTMVAATMLNQSKTAHQAEIDAAAELIDFFRFNVEFMTRVYSEQPLSSPGVWNRLEYRPLEGFVFAVSPFNFTAIGGNLTSSAGADGQQCHLEARVDGRALRPLHDAAVPGGGAAGRRRQPRLRPRLGRRRPGARQPRPGRHPLHRLDRRLPGHVADGRQEHRAVPELPADRRRDRRQGLHRRPPLRRRRLARHGNRPRLVRVPGPEVLCRVARLCPVQPLARPARPPRRADRGDQGRRRLATSRTSWAP